MEPGVFEKLLKNKQTYRNQGETRLENNKGVDRWLIDAFGLSVWTRLFSVDRILSSRATLIFRLS